MKRYILTAIVAAACALGASAQYDYSSVARMDSIETALAQANANQAKLRADSLHKAAWRSGRYFNVGYTSAQTGNGVYAVEKSKLGVFLNKGTAFQWPRHSALGNVVKLGFEMRWFDLAFNMYNDFDRPVTLTAGGSDMGNGYGWTNDNTVSSPTDGGTYYARFKHYQAVGGLFGIGPVITVAPLAWMDNPASSLRLTFYFHYQPTYALDFYTTNLYQNAVDATQPDRDMACKGTYFDHGYVNMMDWGGRLQWKNIGIGIEGRWGSGRFNASQYEEYVSEISSNTASFGINGTNGKTYTRHFGETRFFFSFAF